MKNILRLISLALLINLGACKDSNELSSRDKNVKLLAAQSWGDATVTNTDGNVSDQYTDFVIVFSKNASSGFDGTYVIAHGGYAFSETTGHWKFNEDQTQIVFDDGKEMATQLTSTSLQLDFTVLPTAGRTDGISGHFVFDLKPL